MSENSDHHIVNFKFDRSYSDSMTVRNEREVDEVSLVNISPEPNGKLQKMHKTLITKSMTKKCKYNLN